VLKIANRKSKIKNKKGRLRLTATPAASPSTRLFVITQKCSMKLFLQKNFSRGRKKLAEGPRRIFWKGKAGSDFIPARLFQE
jgi:hypothetical protein